MAKIWPALILSDDVSGKEWIISADRQRPYTIGRSSRCDGKLTFDDRASVSGLHAQIEYDHEYNFWKITDLGSKSGTVVIKASLGYRRSLILDEYERLEHGDRVLLGGKQFGREYGVQCLQWNVQTSNDSATPRHEFQSTDSYSPAGTTSVLQHEERLFAKVGQVIDEMVAQEHDIRSTASKPPPFIAPSSEISAASSEHSPSPYDSEEVSSESSFHPEPPQQTSLQAGSRRSRARSENGKLRQQRTISLYKVNRNERPKAKTLDEIAGTPLSFEVHKTDEVPVHAVLRAAANVKETNLADPSRRLEQFRRATAVLKAVGLS